MSPKVHIPCGIISGIIAFTATQAIHFSLSCLIANFLFDIDHCLEYALFCFHNKEKPTLKRFFSGLYFEEKGTIYVIFHGYEYILLLLILTIASFYTNFLNPYIWAGFLLGYTEHMILDLIGNNCSLKGYSLIYRMLVRFDLKSICTKKSKHNKNFTY